MQPQPKVQDNKYSVRETIMQCYVQYGCGLSAPEGWVNYDSSPRLALEQLPMFGAFAGFLGMRLFPRNIRFGDIVKGLPIPDGTADGVYASHVLEHLSRSDIIRALANTYRILKPGGLFRLIVPDLHWRAARYLAEHERGDNAAADNFIAATGMGSEKRARGAEGLLRAAFGNSAHRWLYDAPLLMKLLQEAGFTEIRRCEIHDSGDPMFDLIEDIGRFQDSGELELALEGRKPARFTAADKNITQ